VLLTQLVVYVATGLLTLVLARVAVACTLAALAHALRHRGCARSVAAVAMAVSPGCLRAFLGAAIGAGLVLGLGASSANAGPTSAGPTGPAPVLDRVIERKVTDSTRTSRSKSTTPPQGRNPVAYVVRPGDSLWSISAASLKSRTAAQTTSHDDIARAWPRWYAANRAVIGADPDLLRPGQHLQSPDLDATPSIGQQR
jgi:nucleoid-associated protein YgaU